VYDQLHASVGHRYQIEQTLVDFASTMRKVEKVANIQNLLTKQQTVHDGEVNSTDVHHKLQAFVAVYTNG